MTILAKDNQEKLDHFQVYNFILVHPANNHSFCHIVYNFKISGNYNILVDTILFELEWKLTI